MSNVKDTDKPGPTDSAAERRYEELEAIYRSAPVGLGLVDRDLRYVRVNDRLAEFIGRPREEIIGRSLGEVVPGAVDKIEPIYRRVNLHLALGGSFEENPDERVVDVAEEH